MTRGFVKLPRAFFASPLWTEPLRRTQIEAYFDLLQRQAFHNTSVPQPKGHVDLKAGQLFISCRKLAEEWRWQGRQVKDFLEYLRDLRIAKLEEMQAGYRITLYDPPADPSKNILVNLSSSEDSSENSPENSYEEKEDTKKSKNYDLKKLPENETTRLYRELHEEFPGVLASVEFIEFKEKKRIQERRPLEYGPHKLRELILEFKRDNISAPDERCETKTSGIAETIAEVLHDAAEKE